MTTPVKLTKLKMPQKVYGKCTVKFSTQRVELRHQTNAISPRVHRSAATPTQLVIYQPCIFQVYSCVKIVVKPSPLLYHTLASLGDLELRSWPFR